MGSMADTGSSVRTAACRQALNMLPVCRSVQILLLLTFTCGQDCVDSSMLACNVAYRRADQAFHAPVTITKACFLTKKETKTIHPDLNGNSG